MGQTEQEIIYRKVSAKKRLPEKDKPVFCIHSDSGNLFSCYRTNDCNTGEEKWQGGAMPDYWLEPVELSSVIPANEIDGIKNADHRAGAMWAIEEINSRLATEK